MLRGRAPPSLTALTMENILTTPSRPCVRPSIFHILLDPAMVTRRSWKVSLASRLAPDCRRFGFIGHLARKAQALFFLILFRRRIHAGAVITSPQTGTYFNNCFRLWSVVLTSHQTLCKLFSFFVIGHLKAFCFSPLVTMLVL